MQPFAGVELDWYKRGEINEKGDNLLSLEIEEACKTDVYTRLGVHFTTTSTECWNVSLDLAWQCLLTDPTDSLVGRFQSFGSPYEIYGANVGRNNLDAAFTLTLDVADRTQIYLETAGQVWQRASSYDVLAGVKCSW